MLERREELATRVVEAQFAARSELKELFGRDGARKCREDASHHLLYLAEATAHEAPSLFREYAGWAAGLLESLGLPRGELVSQLEAIRHVLAEVISLPANAPTLDCLAEGIEGATADPIDQSSSIDPGAPRSALAGEYLAALLAMDRGEALQLISNALDDEVPLDELYLDVFQPVQREVGRLWQTNRISVAVEHYCTAATQLAMAQLYPRVFATPKSGQRLVAAGVGGDLHEIGIRMVSDLLELDGWTSVFLGTNVPSGHVAESLAEQRASLLALSVTLAAHLSEAAALIQKVRSHPGCADVRILVGGRPFLVAPELWRQIGADATAPDARRTVAIAAELGKPAP